MAPFLSLLAIYCSTVALVLASPPGRTPNSRTFVNNYDDLKSNGLVPEGNSVGVYNSLSYNAWTIQSPSDVPVKAGLSPISLPNQITSGIPERTENGTAFITSIYSGSKVKYFDLSSFFFNCEVDVVTGEATDPSVCEVFVTGYKAVTNAPVGPVNFTFVPKFEGLVAPMQFAKLPSTFNTLNKVTFVPTFVVDTATVEAFGLDNVTTTVHL